MSWRDVDEWAEMSGGLEIDLLLDIAEDRPMGMGPDELAVLHRLVRLGDLEETQSWWRITPQGRARLAQERGRDG